MTEEDRKVENPTSQSAWQAFKTASRRTRMPRSPKDTPLQYRTRFTGNIHPNNAGYQMIPNAVAAMIIEKIVVHFNLIMRSRSTLRLAVSLLGLLSLASSLCGEEANDWNQALLDPKAATLARPSPAQFAWHEHERIMFVHFGVATWEGTEKDLDGKTDLSKINPEGFDANKICEVAKLWGAKQVLLVCKHVGGFCWWQTETTDYSVKSIPWKNGKGDLVKDVADACRRHNLDMGVYLYPDDPRYSSQYGRGGRTDDPSKQEEWNRLLRQQLEEVLTLCGKDLVREIWLDGSCVVPLDDIIEKLAPNAVIFQSPAATIRWVGNEDGTTKDPNWNTLDIADLKSGVATDTHSTPDGNAWGPVECDVPLYDHNWFWNPENGRKRRTLDQLMSMYLQSAGRGSVLLLNSTPDTNGEIPTDDVTRYREFGMEIERNFGHPIAQVAKKTGSEVIIPLAKSQRVNCVDLWEAYEYGHRIRSYEIDVMDSDGTWKRVAEGTAIGRRKIDLFPEVTTDAIRVRVTAQVGTPLFRKILVHQACPKLVAAFGQIQPVTHGAEVLASSVHGPSSGAGNLIDGNHQTHWRAANQDAQAWVSIDLGRPRRFASMRAAEPGGHIREFKIEVRNSPDQPWREIFAGGKIGAAFETNLPPVTARYVRLHITRVDGTAAELSELSFTNRPDTWEDVILPTLPSSAGSFDVDLSNQVVNPGQFEIRVEGATLISAAVPLFQGIPGDVGFLEKTGAATYRINRTQALGEGASTGIRLTLDTPPNPDFKIQVRPH